MNVRVKWKPVMLLATSITIFLIFYQYCGPDLQQSSHTAVHGRLLHQMCNTPLSCRDLKKQVDYLQALLRVNEQRCSDTLERLKAQNAEEKKKVYVQKDIIKDLVRQNGQLREKLSTFETYGLLTSDDNYKTRLAPMIEPDTVRTLNINKQTEFDIISYTAFSKDRLYPLDLGMLNKPEIPPCNDRKKEHGEVVEMSLDILNNGVTDSDKPFTPWDLSYGYWRTDHTVGTQYELFFQVKGEKHAFKHVQLFRPFASVQKVQTQNYDKKNEWINLIVPLSGRVDTFRNFMQVFVEQCIKKDQRVFLTIVYLGEEGKDEVNEILETTAQENHFTHYKMIEREGEFSRGVALFEGAQDWSDGNVLLFFCDVDVVFKEGFLDRCRLNTAPSTRVYYPIVFSLYNPSIVYSEYAEIPSWKDQLMLTRDSGFWRTFGFGMTCMYRSDFLFTRGFDTNIQGWGYEDVKLYRKFVQSNIDVIRAPDPGIFHTWHEKHCDPHLPPAQYHMCLGSKALGEASHAQLGMLAFKDLKMENERLHGLEEEEEHFENLEIVDEYNNLDSEIGI